MSAKFYDRFAAVSFRPGSPGWPADLSLDPATGYPWPQNQTPANLAPANLGQAKHLFAWDLQPWIAVDADNDSLPDYWENYWFHDLTFTNNASSDSDGDGISNADELAQSTNPHRNSDDNGNNIPDDWELFWKDQFAIYPGALAASLTHRESSTQQLYLNNPVSPDADFTVTVSNNLAGSQVVYDYEDSLTGGATYNWTEISTTGTLLDDISETDNAAQEVVLNNFTVPFYGTHYDRVYVASNGLLTFGSPSTDSGNYIIPYEYEPNNFIALFWDDLDTNDASAEDGGEVYFQEFADRLIVQYEAVMRDSDSDPTTESNTFQAVLHQSGLIEVFYKQMGGNQQSATVGIEDASGTLGIEVLYNGYRTIHPTFTLSDGLALSYTPEPAKFVQVSPLTGTTTTGNITTLDLSFNSFDLAPGRYTADIDLAHTGTGTTPWTIPAVLEVTNPPTQIAITSPQDGTVFWSDQSLSINVSASDDDFGIERVEFFYDETKFHEDSRPSYYYYWPNPSIGTYALTARAVDLFGTVTISDPVTITVLEDSDSDRMEDGWERSHFGDLLQDPLGDYDGEGAANLLEYDRGTDPTDPNDTPVNQASIIVITEPEAAYTVFQGNNIYLRADVSDPDSELDRVDFYYGDSFIGSDTSVNYGSASRSWYNAPPGTHSLTARAVDIYGTVTISDPVTITVLEDSDSDRMDDAWERAHFDDLSQDPLGDYDDDGAANLLEYDRGTDPTDPNDTPVNQASVIVLTEPVAASNHLEGRSITLRADVSDPDSELDRVDFYYGDSFISSDTSVYSYAYFTWYNAPPGTHSLTARAVDIYGTVTISDPVAITVSEDTDRDQLGDDWERQHFGDLISASGDGDPDRDGLSNREEFQAASNPKSTDSDGDGYGDHFEFTHSTGINSATDSDANGIPDGVENYYDMNPGSDTDSDGDGLPDDYEATFGLSNPNGDLDRDGLSNLEEYQLGTRPDYFDSDGDLLPDGWEHQHGLDLLNHTPLDSDSDGDGLDLFDEYLNGTDPNNNDSDGDGTDDQEEVDQGSNPTNGGDGGNPPPADATRDVEFGIYGDYASWEMTVKGLGPDNRILKLRTAAPGGRNERSLKLHRNSDYEIRLRWLATREGVDMDWYCWEAKVDGLPTQATYESYDGTRLSEVAEFFPVANGWIVDNREGLLTSHVHMNADAGGNVAGGTVAYLRKVDTVTINTFIPPEWINSPNFLSSTILEGDNRDNWNKNGSFRTHQQCALTSFIDLDADGMIDDSDTRAVGLSVSYDKSTSLNGNTLKQEARDDWVEGAPLKKKWARASVNTIEFTPVEIVDKSKVVYDLSASVGNPLWLIAPKIDYNFRLTIDYSNFDNPSFSIVGKHDGYPAYEVFINETLIHSYHPGQTKTPWALWGDGDEYVNETGSIN